MRTAISTETGLEWRTLYDDIRHETDKGKLLIKIRGLEAAIFFRFQEIELDPSAAEVEELRKTAEALLRIKLEKLGYSIETSLFGDRLWV